MDLYEACENGNEERVVEVLVYGEHGLAFGRRRRRHIVPSNANSLATSARAPLSPVRDPHSDAASLAATLAASAKQLLSPRDVLRTRGTAGRTPLLAACMGAQLGVVRLLLGESCAVYFTSRQKHETEALLQPLAAEYEAFRVAQQDEGMAASDTYFRVTMAEKHDGGGERVPVATVRFPPAYTVPPQDLLDGATHVDDFGNTPLQCVSCFGCGTTETHVDDGLALARQLLCHGDQPNLPKIANQWTPLHWAAYNGNHELCGILLDPLPAVEKTDKVARLGKAQFSIPLLANSDNLFAADVAGRRGLALANEMRALRTVAAGERNEYARWRLRLDHVTTLRFFTREFLENATSLVRYVNEMNARLPRQLLRNTDKATRHHRASRTQHRRLFTCADAIRYGQHLLYWMGCFGLEDDVRALLEMALEMPADLAANLDTGVQTRAAPGAFTVVHLRPLYVCSCEENKRQSVLHAVAVHGQQGIVQLLLSQMLYEQTHPQSAAHVVPTLQTKKTERQVKKRASSVAPSSPATLQADGVDPADLDDPTKLDVVPLVAVGWRNYRHESPLFLAVLYLRDDVVATFRSFLSPASLAWELSNCNVEGSFIHHVASDSARQTLGVVDTRPQKYHHRLNHAEYVMLFDGLTKRPFKESLLEAMREESVIAPSLRVTPVGHKLTPPSVWGLMRGSCTDYVVVGATDKVLVSHAQFLQLKIKHRGSTVRSKYNASTPHLFEPFRSLQRQQVVLDIVQKNVNLQKHLQKKNLEAVFPLHDVSGCKNIMRHWVRSEDGHHKIFQPFAGNSLSQFLRERRTHQYEMLWPLLTYFGEKHAFYYAFLLFYAVWLVVLAVPGALCQLAWSIGHARYVSPLFAVFTSLWATLFVERWKRKRSEILSTFGNFKRNRSEQAPAFYGDFQVDVPERGVVDTTFPKSLQLARIYAGFPLLFTMAGLVVAIFIGVKLNASSTAILQSVFPWMPAPLSTYVIPMLNAVSMLVLDNVYTQLAVALTQWENHRTVWEFESMLATKLFWFKFLNAFLSLFWVAFVDRDAPALRKQLVIIMGARQIWFVIQRSIFPLLSVAYAWHKAGFILGNSSSGGGVGTVSSPTVSGEEAPRKRSWFSLTHEWYYAELSTPAATATEEVNATPPPIVLLQELMHPSDFLMGKQMEVMLHFGYITMFVSVLPIAPLLALGSVVLSTRLDVACCTQAKRRPRFESETEISTFMSILEFMSFAAVAVNCAVLFFTTMDDFDSLLLATGSMWKSTETLSTPIASAFYLKKLWVLLVLEHVVLGLKALLSLTIDDAATWVQNDEDRMDDEAKQTAQLERARRSVRRAPLEEEDKMHLDAVVSSSSSVTTDPLERQTSTLAKFVAEKYELAVRERDAAIERERMLQCELDESRRRLEDLMIAQKADPSCATPTTCWSTSSPLPPSLPIVLPPTQRRYCWICFLLQNTHTVGAQIRCLTCRQFFCGECDETVHLDDLGVREPKHFRVNTATDKITESDESCGDMDAPVAANSPRGRQEQAVKDSTKLRNLLAEYLLVPLEQPVVSETVEAVVHRCAEHDTGTLVIRYLRNTLRKRAFDRSILMADNE